MNAKILILFCLVFASTLPTVFAVDDDDIEIFDLELEKLLHVGSGILATILAILTFSAYKRTGNKRLLFVCIAMILFALDGFLVAHELILPEWELVDTISSVLNFAIILTLFIGIVKK